MANLFEKDRDAVLDFGIDWSTWLEDGEILVSSQWLVPEGLARIDDTYDTSGRVVVWLSGGTAGTTYRLTNRVQTSRNRTDDRSIFVRVLER